MDADTKDITLSATQFAELRERAGRAARYLTLEGLMLDKLVAARESLGYYNDRTAKRRNEVKADAAYWRAVSEGKV